MRVGEVAWYRMVLETIGAVVRETYPRTRPAGPDVELTANLLHHARELGADARGLRAVLEASPEFADNAAPPAPDPDPARPAPGPRLALPVGMDGTRGWRDASGGRPLLFCSWFPALWMYRHDRARFFRTLDLLHRWGVDGLRIFLAVGALPYWRGREVLPQAVVDGSGRAAWSDYDEILVGVLEALRVRGMAAHVTAGDLQIVPDEREVYARAARVIQAAGLVGTVAMVDVNEAWQNTRARRDDPAYCARLVEPFAALGVPWATSANSGLEGIDGESRSAILLMSRQVGAPVATVHGSGGTTRAVRRAFNVRHEGGQWDVALWQGEPRGPGADVSAGAMNAAGWVVLTAAMAAMTGQGYVLHCSRGVRDRDDDEPWQAFAPYFIRARAVLDQLPRRNPVLTGHGGNRGSHPLAVLVSTRPDGRFHEDAPGVREQFHRCDVVQLDDGRRIVMAYGGETSAPRRAEWVVGPSTWRVVDTHGRVVERVRSSRGQVWSAPGGEDGYVLIEEG